MNEVVGETEPFNASPKDDFEPPKYITSLIAAVNDGAKTAQTGALALLVLGIYLMAVAISTTDEDLLLGHTTSIAQFGVQVAPEVSFGIAPLVFVAVHVFTLIRYDMLAVNLRHLRRKLDEMVPEDEHRESCRQLLANVEFIAALIVPRGSPLHSRLFGFVARAVIAGFPVFVLLALQGSALRYRNDGIDVVQRVALAIDLAVLVWFFYRQQLARGEVPRFSRRWLARWTRLLLLPAVVAVANGLWWNIPGPSAGTVRAGDYSVRLHRAWRQPLDLLFCPGIGWGCRYLTAAHRTLVGRVWKPEAVADLRGKHPDLDVALAAVEGASLSERTLRFANLDGSRLYGASLIGADLRGATLSDANLSGADLLAAHLNGADLNAATLNNADLIHATLNNATLIIADLTSAALTGADLSGADLSGANLSGAHLGADAEYFNVGLIGAERAIKQQQQLDRACGTNAKLPPGMTLDPCYWLRPLRGESRTSWTW
jgi:hypothetical protein